MLPFHGPPSSWIARHGKPAKCAGTGMPSLETDGGFLVFDLLTAFQHIDPDTGRASYDFYPRDYAVLAHFYPEGKVSAHFQFSKRRILEVEDGQVKEKEYDLPPSRAYRPLIHYTGIETLNRMGSQVELSYRYGVGHAMRLRREGLSEEEMVKKLQEQDEAEDRAMEWLKQFLTPYQRLELALHDQFHVRGRLNLYLIDVSNGFDIVDEDTHEVIVSYCLHTEHWMPAGDQALAILLKLRTKEGELELLDNANLGHYSSPSRPTWEQVRAAELEYELF